MLKTAFVIYRKWGFDILKEIHEFQKIRGDFEISILITTKNPEFKITKSIKRKIEICKVDPDDQQKIFNILAKRKIKIVFLYSWSYIIKERITKKFLCLCLHPSLLPAYRGGTPIQHQLINGEKNSGVTIFKMNEGIDAGDIYQQASMSLLGDINDIFSRMVNLGAIITRNLITDYMNGELVFKPQKNLKKSQIYKRRKPYQSEIYINKAESMSYEEVNNIIRGLVDPYPNAFLSIGNDIIYIQEIIKYKDLPKKAVVINKNTKLKNIKNKKLFLKLKDGYGRLAEYKILLKGIRK
jgi:methionyl-tRNA formyltransferase